METGSNTGFKLQNFIKIYSGCKIFSFAPLSSTNSSEVTQIIHTTGYLDSFHSIVKSFYDLVFNRPTISVLIPIFFFMKLPLIIKLPYIFTAVFTLFHLSSFLRALFYVKNPLYVAYFDSLGKSIEDNHSMNYMRKLSQFHTDFSSYPTCYSSSFQKNYNFDINILRRMVGYIASWLIFPGSKSIINMALSKQLHFHRNCCLVQKGIRFKIKNCQGDFIDCMYKKGGDKTLVIVSMGNCAFYEFFIPFVKSNEFSILGWNHPGFCCSTGSPDATGEKNSITSVLEFAINYLKYSPEDIIVYGWSIGTYSASYAGLLNYNLRGIILDAGFDDLRTLGKRTVGETLCNFLFPYVDYYYDLNVTDNVLSIKCPILIVIRGHDEIMCRGPPHTNVGINVIRSLVLKHFSIQYPNATLDISDSFIFDSIPPIESYYHFNKPKSDGVDNDTFHIPEDQIVFIKSLIKKLTTKYMTGHGEISIEEAFKDFLLRNSDST